MVSSFSSLSLGLTRISLRDPRDVIETDSPLFFISWLKGSVRPLKKGTLTFPRRSRRSRGGGGGGEGGAAGVSDEFAVGGGGGGGGGRKRGSTTTVQLPFETGLNFRESSSLGFVKQNPR